MANFLVTQPDASSACARKGRLSPSQRKYACPSLLLAYPGHKVFCTDVCGREAGRLRLKVKLMYLNDSSRVKMRVPDSQADYPICWAKTGRHLLLHRPLERWRGSGVGRGDVSVFLKLIWRGRVYRCVGSLDAPAPIRVFRALSPSKQEVAKIVGECMKLEPHGVGRERPA
jgi:hypothetical protein